MRRSEQYREHLLTLPEDQWPAYLGEHSGLPGPRGNLELLQVVADLGSAELLDRLAGSDDEYLACCGVVGLGRQLAADPTRAELELRLHRHATDARWRVREAVAMAVQRLGDADLPATLRLVDGWAADPHPLVQRAAVAGICEPRLLHTPAGARAALDACDRVTGSLLARDAAQRREPDVRVLRKALGYCWSVAVAADPAAGLPRFLALAGLADRDAAWIDRENRGKARLARLL